LDNIMFARVGIAALLAVMLGFAASSASDAAAQTPAPEKRVTLTPSSGPVGTVVTAELVNARPGVLITAIFKSPGDPVLGTATTDASGVGRFTFTIPFVVGGTGTFQIYFTDFSCFCQIAVPFTVTGPAPTPTVTPTRPPATPTATATPATALPTATPTALVATPTATPTATATPRVPVLGTTFDDGPGGGPNVGVLGLGILAVITVLAWFTATRRGPGAPAMAYVRRPDDGNPDYSTELDLASLEALRRPFRPEVSTVSPRRGNVAWAIGAGFSAVAGFVLLRRK
jgi:hypothetical protein